jgi:proteasome accessory factor C
VTTPGLGPGGAEADGPADLLGLDGLQPRVDAAEPAFEACLAAVQARRAVRFPYRKPGEAVPAERHVEPWGVLSWRGRWYLAGFDRGRREARVFRLSRVTGPVRAVGAAGAVTVPDGVDLRAMVTRWSSSGGERPRTARIAVRVGAGHALRRWSRPVPVEPGSPYSGVGADLDVLERTFVDVDRLARWLAGYGADVVVLDPPELRTEVVRRLRAVAEAAQVAAGGDGADYATALAAAEERRSRAVAAAEPAGRAGGREEPPSEDRLSRLLALVPWLRARPGVSVAAAAAAFGITPRALVDDLELLFLCGLPGGSPGDLIDISYEGGKITVVDPQTLDRPLRLTVDEATALLVAARALADLPGLAGREALERAVARIEERIPARPAAGVEVRLDAPNAVLAVLQRALRDGRRVHLRYLVWSRDELTERDVDPMRLLSMDGHWYLEGWCHRAEAVRMFRLDSVVGGPAGVKVLDVPAAPPPGTEVRDVSAGVFRPAPGDLLAVVDVTRAARWAADHYPVDAAGELPDGGLRLSIYAAGTAWLRRLLLGLGAEARVVGPPSLVTELLDTATKALAGYEATARPD